MGFFRKLFGGSDREEETAAEAPVSSSPPAEAAALVAPTVGDPYRGPAFVATALEHDEVVEVGPAAPIFTYRGRVLSLVTNPRGPLPLRALVYTGLDENRFVLRRVTFGEKGVRIDWEHRTPFEKAIEGYVVRIEDRILVPLRNGVMAVHLVTGKPCWELPHPSVIAKPPQVDRQGNVFLVFEDQSWMIVAPRDGSTVREGIARHENDVEKIAHRCQVIGDQHRSGAHYGGVEVAINGSAVRVTGTAKQVDGEPTAPTLGKYPIDSEWEANEWIVLVGGKLLVALARRWGDKRWAAVGILEPTTLEPLQLLELGEVRTDLDCWVVDDMLVVDTDVNDSPDDVFFVIDPVAERVIAMLREEKADAFLFDRDGARIWAKPL